ncbi:hypothetical protein, partial [Sulfurimonas sp.]
MFQNNMDKLFHPLQKLYDVTELILVGSNIEGWREIIQNIELTSVHYIDTHEYKEIKETVPKNWNVTTTLLAKEDGKIEYFHLTNPNLNGTNSHEYFQTLWKNLATKSVEQKEAVSIKTFLEQNSLENSTTMLVIDSFDGNNIVQDIQNFNIAVVTLHILSTEKESYDELMLENGYKCIEVYEDNHPEVKLVVYSRDYKQQKQNIQQKLDQE